MAIANYVSAPQANIYFNGILIDECYDIQYSYREAKEPIYGYLSQKFDAVLKGTVIITGALTINYKHDQYLYKALEKSLNPVGNSEVYFNKRPGSLKKMQENYKVALQNYADGLKKQAELKKRLQEEETQLEDSVDMLNQVYATLEKNVEDAKNALATFRQPLSTDALKRLDHDYEMLRTAIVQNAEIDDQIINLINDPQGQLITDKVSFLRGLKFDTNSMIKRNDEEYGYFSEYLTLIGELDRTENMLARENNDTSDPLEELRNKVDATQKELEDINIAGLREEIKKAKDGVDGLIVTAADLANAPSLSESEEDNAQTPRAEDFREGFTIEFNYHGSAHKRLLECQLLGHGHVLTQSGMPVKEQYTFIAKELE